jgi:hypothetical protein
VVWFTVAEMFGEVIGDPARWISVADESVIARVWQFADGWAGFSDAMDDVYLAGVGACIAPEELSLEMLLDSNVHHFDLGRPLLYQQALSVSKAARTAGDRPTARPRRIRDRPRLRGDGNHGRVVSTAMPR